MYVLASPQHQKSAAVTANSYTALIKQHIVDTVIFLYNCLRIEENRKV